MTYVRRAMEEDIPSLIALCERFHGESPIHRDAAFSYAKVDRLIREWLGNPDCLLVAACDDDGRPIGLLALYCGEVFYSHEREVGDLCFYVTPEHRGGRAAWLMVQEAISWARLKGARHLDIGVSSGIEVERAEKFFARFGFDRVAVLLRCTM